MVFKWVAKLFGKFFGRELGVVRDILKAVLLKVVILVGKGAGHNKVNQEDQLKHYNYNYTIN